MVDRVASVGEGVGLGLVVGGLVVVSGGGAHSRASVAATAVIVAVVHYIGTATTLMSWRPRGIR